MEYPDIRFRQEKVMFDKDAQGAYEDRFTIRQDGGKVEVDYYSFEPYEGKTSEGTYRAEILCWDSQYVKLRNERGQMLYLNRKKQDFAGNDDDYFTHFTFPGYRHGEQACMDVMLQVMNLGLKLTMDRPLAFTLSYPDDADLDARGLRFNSEEIDGMKLRCELNGFRRFELVTEDEIHPFAIEVGINPDFNEKNRNQGYVRGICLKAKEKQSVPVLRRFFEESPDLRPL